MPTTEPSLARRARNLGHTAQAFWIPPPAGAAFGVARRLVYSGDGGRAFNAMLGSFAITHFNWYARPVVRLLVANFEEPALGFYAGRAEAAR